MSVRGAALPLLYAHEDRHWWTRGMLAATQALLEADGWRGEGDILDLGCGGGKAGATLPARRRTGLDLSAVALRHARRRPGLTLVQGSLAALPFTEQAFTLILALDAIDQHGLDSGAVVAHCGQLLRRRGRLLVRVSAHSWLQSAYDVAAGTGARMSVGHLRQLVESAGLYVRRLTYANSCLFPLSVVRRLQTRWLGAAAEVDLRPPPRWLNEMLFAVLRGEAAWLRWRDMPWGLSLYCLAVKP